MKTLTKAREQSTKTATMPPAKELPVNERLLKLRDASKLKQADFAKKFFRVNLRTYQRYEAAEHHSDLPGPVQIIIEALERGVKLPVK